MPLCASEYVYNLSEQDAGDVKIVVSGICAVSTTVPLTTPPEAPEAPGEGDTDGEKTDDEAGMKDEKDWNEEESGIELDMTT